MYFYGNDRVIGSSAGSKIDTVKGERPVISSAKAYKICSLLKKMMKQHQVNEYMLKYYRLMDTPYHQFLLRVEQCLMFDLDYSKTEAKDWINEQL